MSKFSDYIGSQFGNPRGLVGKICCIIMNLINNAMYRRVISLLDISENEKMLDIGFGNGYLLSLADKKFSPQMYGIDISEDMKKLALKRNKKSHSEGRLHLKTGDCCNLDYKENMFSAVTSINTVYFWDDISKGMSEIYRCLKNNGVFLNVVYTKEWLDKLSYTNKGFKKLYPEQLVKYSQDAGFKDTQVQKIVRGKSFVVICRK